MKTAKMEALLRGQDATENERDNAVHRYFLSGERYLVDFADDFHEQGWEQFDTDSDAYYFGVWVNWRKLLTLCYAEGDWTLVVCPDATHYNAEIRNLIEFHGEGRIALVFDAKGATEYRQDRSKFLLGGVA